MTTGLFDRALRSADERTRTAAAVATQQDEALWTKWEYEAQNRLIYDLHHRGLPADAWRRGGVVGPDDRHYLEATVEGRVLRYYPQTQRLVLTAVSACCQRPWESFPVRSVVSLGDAEKLRLVRLEWCGRSECHPDGAAA